MSGTPQLLATTGQLPSSSVLTTFLPQIMRTIGMEGSYSNDPDDAGGETIWGITYAVARAFGYNGPMISMSQQTAIQIYYRRYVLQVGLDAVDALSSKLAFRGFDIAVNMGPKWPGMFIQRALNVLNNNSSIYANITVDGSIGAMTLAALKAYLTGRGADGEAVLMGMVAAQQSVRYIEIAEDTSSQEKFEYGWQLERIVGMALVG